MGGFLVELLMKIPSIFWRIPDELLADFPVELLEEFQALFL